MGPGRCGRHGHRARRHPVAPRRTPFRHRHDGRGVGRLRIPGSPPPHPRVAGAPRGWHGWFVHRAVYRLLRRQRPVPAAVEPATAPRLLAPADAGRGTPDPARDPALHSRPASGFTGRVRKRTQRSPVVVYPLGVYSAPGGELSCAPSIRTPSPLPIRSTTIRVTTSTRGTTRNSSAASSG